MSGFEFSAKDLNRIQRIAVKESRLGIPVVFARFTLHRARVQGVPVGDGTLDIRSNDRAIAATLKLARDQSRLEATALALMEDPTSFLSAIQIGITVIGLV